MWKWPSGLTRQVRCRTGLERCDFVKIPGRRRVATFSQEPDRRAVMNSIRSALSSLIIMNNIKPPHLRPCACRSTAKIHPSRSQAELGRRLDGDTRIAFPALLRCAYTCKFDLKTANQCSSLPSPSSILVSSPINRHISVTQLSC